MAASAVALFLIFRSPDKPKLATPAPSIQLTKPAPPPPVATTWNDFERSDSMQSAMEIISKLPASEEIYDQIAAYIKLHDPSAQEPTDFANTGRVVACLQFLATYVKWDSPYRSLLQTLSVDRSRPVIVRDVALRGLIDLAFRKHSNKESGDETWRSELSDFLIKSDFGLETSMGGLALQAAVFVQNQGIAQVDESALTTRLQNILLNHTTVNEASLVAALEVCGVKGQATLVDAILPIVQNPRSDAVLVMGVATLGKIGRTNNRDQLTQLQPTTAALYRTTESAWLAMTKGNESTLK